MAQPPDSINETFKREVDENLRRDRARDFARKNAKWFVGGLILFLVAIGGWMYWQHLQRQKSEREVEALAELYKNIGTGKLGGAAQKLDTLSASNQPAVRASALFTRAALALEQNDRKLAIAKFREAAEDDDLPQPFRDSALLRQTALEFDSIKPEEVIARLQPLAKAGGPWFGSAAEMTALAMIKQGNTAEAGRLFVAIARDVSVPRPIRARAVQIASSLGVDVSALPSLAPQ